MLPHYWRLPLRKIPDFFLNCRAVNSRSLTFLFRLATNSSTVGWAVIVKKTLGGAVVRQKSRRRLRAAIARIMHANPRLGGLEIVLILKKTVTVVEYEKELQTIIQQLAE